MPLDLLRIRVCDIKVLDRNVLDIDVERVCVGNGDVVGVELERVVERVEESSAEVSVDAGPRVDVIMTCDVITLVAEFAEDVPELVKDAPELEALLTDFDSAREPKTPARTPPIAAVSTTRPTNRAILRSRNDHSRKSHPNGRCFSFSTMAGGCKFCSFTRIGPVFPSLLLTCG